MATPGGNVYFLPLRIIWASPWTLLGLAVGSTALLSGGGPTCSFTNTSLVGSPAANPAGVMFPDGLFQFTAGGC